MTKKYKIGVLTQPLHDNYGGLLQAYSLKETLESLGHEVIIINRPFRQISVFRKILYIAKCKILGRKTNPNMLLTSKQRSTISQHTLSFRKKYIPNLSKLITTNEGMSRLNNMGFDAYIVGSDQAWRPKYSPNISSYFLDFAEDQSNLKRISYAVSFGVSEWEFNKEETETCARLAKKFDAISVREDSGVKLVNDYLGMEATCLVDPTMLIPIEQFKKIAKDRHQKSSNGTLKSYVLDKTKLKQDLIKQVEERLGLIQFEVLPKKSLKHEEIKSIEDFIFPSPADWLQGFEDAKFVVTDSFHGMVFSILFNIPFIAIGNKTRGIARFDSLLKIVNLEDRLVIDPKPENVQKIIDNDIDWEQVNSIVAIERKRALDFLISNLD